MLGSFLGQLAAEHHYQLHYEVDVERITLFGAHMDAVLLRQGMGPPFCAPQGRTG